MVFRSVGSSVVSGTERRGEQRDMDTRERQGGRHVKTVTGLFDNPSVRKKTMVYARECAWCLSTGMKT